MWQCGNCSELVENDFEVCWNCQTERDDSVASIRSDPQEWECEACGAEVGIDDDICANCGADISEVAGPQISCPKTRLLNILKVLTEKGCISRFSEDSENNFEVFTQYSAAFDMMTWLKFEVTSDVMRVRFTHLLGTLDLNQEFNPHDLINVLMSNRNSYNWTSGYFSVNYLGDEFWVYLENSHFYLLKWHDEEIADAMSLQFLDLLGLGIGEPPKPIKMFRQRH